MSVATLSLLFVACFFITLLAGRPTVKVTAGYPALARNERAMNLKISLPLALFEAPSLTASIKVDHPSQTIQIDTDAIAEAVRGAVGMDVDIQVVEPS